MKMNEKETKIKFPVCLFFVCFFLAATFLSTLEKYASEGNSFALIVNGAVGPSWKEAVGGCQQQYLTSESALNPGAGECGNKEAH